LARHWMGRIRQRDSRLFYRTKSARVERDLQLAGEIALHGNCDHVCRRRLNHIDRVPIRKPQVEAKVPQILLSELQLSSFKVSDSLIRQYLPARLPVEVENIGIIGANLIQPQSIGPQPTR